MRRPAKRLPNLLEARSTLCTRGPLLDDRVPKLREDEASLTRTGNFRGKSGRSVRTSGHNPRRSGAERVLSVRQLRWRRPTLGHRVPERRKSLEALNNRARRRVESMHETRISIHDLRDRVPTLRASVSQRHACGHERRHEPRTLDAGVPGTFPRHLPPGPSSSLTEAPNVLAQAR